jgi:phage-related protein
MAWTIEYYSEKVRLAIDAWPVGIRAFYARTMDRIKINGPNLGMPFTRSMGEGLIEVRAIGKEGIGRALFCTVKGRRVIVLHAFIKKTDKTPLRELETARKRLLEVRNENTR